MEIEKKKHVVTCQIFIILLSTPPPPAAAQVAGTETMPVSSGQEVNQKMAIIFAALITAFFVFGIFSFYKRRWRERRFRRAIGIGGDGGGVRWRPARGLDPSFIATFPSLVYSSVKGLKIGKISLECAICLCEFENSDKLRLIPNCSHVFHCVCVDAWLLSNSTCPVCRTDLSPDSGEESPSILNFDSNTPPSSSVPQSHVAIPVVDDRRIGGNQRTLPRSNSTGHERFTLRLPEAIRSQLMNRTRSLAELPRERSLRQGYRSETGETGGWRNFLRRTLSVPAPAVGRTAVTGRSPVEDDARERSFERLRAVGIGQSSAAN